MKFGLSREPVAWATVIAAVAAIVGLDVDAAELVGVITGAIAFVGAVRRQVSPVIQPDR